MGCHVTTLPFDLKNSPIASSTASTVTFQSSHLLYQPWCHHFLNLNYFISIIISWFPLAMNSSLLYTIVYILLKLKIMYLLCKLAHCCTNSKLLPSIPLQKVIVKNPFLLLSHFFVFMLSVVKDYCFFIYNRGSGNYKESLCQWSMST